ncbi:unnamed protein product [Colias eurytheme]|nr:unnamed protein product [Colias eurytheme]
MPLKRTPPPTGSTLEPLEILPHGGSAPNISTCRDDNNIRDFPTNITTRGNKRKHDQDMRDELQAFKAELLSSLNNWKESQDNKIEAILTNINELRSEYKDLHSSVKFVSDKYDDVMQSISVLQKENQEKLKHIYDLEIKMESLERHVKSSSVEIRNIPKQKKSETTGDLINIVQNIGTLLKIDMHEQEKFDSFNTIISDLDAVSVNCIQVDEIYKNKQLLRNGSNFFNVITINIRSIHHNFDLLTAFLTTLPIQMEVIVLTECWSKEGVPPPNLIDYNVYYTNKYLNQNDGVVVYVKKSLEAVSAEPEMVDGNCLILNIDKYSIVCSYRPPCYTNPRPYLERLDTILKEIKQQHVIFTGDININTICNDIQSAHLNEYLCILASHGLELGVTCPTRLNNCLDHFMVKTTDEWQTMVFPPLTDHSPILLQIRNNKIARLKTDLSIQVLDYPLALEKISLIDWTQYFSLRDVNHCAECLVNNISGIIKECTTVKYLSKKKAPLKPWITTGVVRSIRKRDKLHKKAKLRPSDIETVSAYIKYRNTCNKIIKSLKQKYYQMQLQHNEKDIKKTWNIIKDVCNMKVKNDLPTELLTIGSNTKESLNKINNFFTTVGGSLAEEILKILHKTENDLANQIKSSTSMIHSMSFVPTDSYEIGKIINELKASSAPGLDGISSRLIKEAKEFLIGPLEYLCNLSLEQGQFPDIFKKAIVSPIYKSEDKKDVTNYRPVSLLPTLSKVLERLVNYRLTSFLEKNKLLTNSQYGFRKGKSTEEAILRLTTLVYEYLDKGDKVIGVFLDFKKAFDTISIPILLSKLESLGVRGHVHQWFQSYLSCREQYVRVKNDISDASSCRFGIPQGSTSSHKVALHTHTNVLRHDTGVCVCVAVAEIPDFRIDACVLLFAYSVII